LFEKRLDFKGIFLGDIFIGAWDDQAEDIFQGRARRIVRYETGIGEGEITILRKPKRRSIEGCGTENQGRQPHALEQRPPGKASIFVVVTQSRQFSAC
jgi:hypothetical protein